jgi:amidase
MTEWIGRTATEIASAVRAGQVTARTVVSEHLDRIMKLNPELGAFVRVRSVSALSEADDIDARSDRPELRLAGVPIAIKDNLAVRGEPMRFGSAALADEPQAEDHPVVARLREAGAVVVGLTNLPEFAIYPFTDSVFGIARNPWDRSRTPGGSSGGSAAAVASAMVPIAHGNDGLGSIRIPAAACGLFGIKPGRGVVPSQIGADSWQGLSENGPLTTTIADAALMLEVMAGAALGLAEPSRLRIAVSIKPPGPGVSVHRGFREEVKTCGELLMTLGHDVAADDPPYPWWSALATLSRWFACSVADAQPYLEGAGLERRTRWHVRAGKAVLNLRPPRDGDKDRLRDSLQPFFERHDLLVMPSLARPCPLARRWGDRSFLRNVMTSISFSPMTGIWNLAGFPAASVPIGPRFVGLPGSVQLIAAPGGESLLLAVAAQLERTCRWQRHATEYQVVLPQEPLVEGT